MAQPTGTGPPVSTGSPGITITRTFQRSPSVAIAQ